MAKDYGCKGSINARGAQRVTDYARMPQVVWVMLEFTPLLFLRVEGDDERLKSGVLVDHCGGYVYDAKPLFDKHGGFDLYYCDKVSLKGDDRPTWADAAEEEAAMLAAKEPQS
jgi:hypothetical protein